MLPRFLLIKEILSTTLSQRIVSKDNLRLPRLFKTVFYQKHSQYHLHNYIILNLNIHLNTIQSLQINVFLRVSDITPPHPNIASLSRNFPPKSMAKTLVFPVCRLVDVLDCIAVIESVFPIK